MSPIFNLMSIFLAAGVAIAIPHNHTTSNALERRMTYHDSGVTIRFAPESGKTLHNAVFTTNNFRITAGQDPDGVNYIGAVHNSYDANPGRRIDFTAGRKASKEVADFWNNEIEKDQSTFRDTPDDLNFAFLGQSKLKVGDMEWVSEGDIGLAMGQKGGRNNWWFGGKGCRNYDGASMKRVVQCTGRNPKDNWPWYIRFQRGGTGVDEVVALRMWRSDDRSGWDP